MNSQSLSLPEQEVHLWHFQTDHLVGIPEEMALRYLDAQEYQRYNRYLCPLKRQQFLTARMLLKQLLGRYLDVPVEKVQLKYSRRQKPFLEGKLEFNMSHSGRHLLIAVARQAVGVDIQEGLSIKEEQLLQGLSVEEQQKVPREALLRYWVLKEALWKAKNQPSDAEKLLDTWVCLQPQAQGSFSFLLDHKYAAYLNLYQHLHMAWVVNDPEPACRLNGILLDSQLNKIKR